MKPTYLLLLVPFLLVANVRADTLSKDEYASAEKYIVECATDWAESVVTGDVSRRKVYFSEKFLGTRTNGDRYDKVAVVREGGPSEVYASNSINNVEVVNVSSPEPGDWTLQVRPAAIPHPALGYVLVATGASGVEIDDSNSEFHAALQQVFEELAQAIIRDAEGATKFVEICVEGADSVADARSVGFTIAESPLVKTALFASDPNWGRFIMAIGRSPLSRIDTDRIDLYLGSVRLLHQGLPDPEYRESLGQSEMSREEISIRVNLNLGDANARIWTSDLSYEYVKINAEYRS